MYAQSIKVPLLYVLGWMSDQVYKFIHGSGTNILPAVIANKDRN